MFLISEGSDFHNMGAAIVNDLSLIVPGSFSAVGLITCIVRQVFEVWQNVET